MKGKLEDDFKLLSVEARLQIIRLLRQAPSLCVNALAAHLNTPITLSALSQHLRLLKASGWVNSQKMGTWVHYSLNEAKFNAFKHEVEKLLRPRSHKTGSCTHKDRRANQCAAENPSARSRKT